MSPRSNPLVRFLKGFGKFWWDFLVGDTPELFVSTLGIIAVTLAVGRLAHNGALATVLLPVMVITALLITVRRAWPKR